MTDLVSRCTYLLASMYQNVPLIHSARRHYVPCAAISKFDVTFVMPDHYFLLFRGERKRITNKSRAKKEEEKGEMWGNFRTRFSFLG